MQPQVPLAIATHERRQARQKPVRQIRLHNSPIQLLSTTLRSPRRAASCKTPKLADGTPQLDALRLYHGRAAAVEVILSKFSDELTFKCCSMSNLRTHLMV